MKKSRLYRGFRYPAEIISHVGWLYFRFALSFRDIEELMASRGIIVTYETIRQWTLKFGPGYANELRRRQPQREDKWHLDEVVLTIKGKHHYLWRAVDQNGHVLDILMQSRRNRQAQELCRVWSIANTKASITVQNSCTNRRGNENDRCGASSHRAMLSAFYRLMARSTMLSGVSETV
ncbi:hypothetical protein AAKU64_004340 [Undibacterium sp. GrIS 1.8]